MRLGEIVIYTAREGEVFNGATECPAVVVRVWGSDGRCVNLRLLRDGRPDDNEWRTSVLLDVGHEAPPAPGTWRPCGIAHLAMRD